METELIRKPSAEFVEFVETECVVRDIVQACTAPRDYKCPYRRPQIRS